MKLAEALINRADIQKRIEQLKIRIMRSAKVQEGEEPPEDANALIAELEQLYAELAKIVKSINRTNSSVEFCPGKTIADVLAERDAISAKRNALETIAESAAIRQERYSKSEVKFISTINIGEIQKTIDRLSKEFRELDSKIQEKNWTVDLIE